MKFGFKGSRQEKDVWCSSAVCALSITTLLCMFAYASTSSKEEAQALDSTTKAALVWVAISSHFLLLNSMLYGSIMHTFATTEKKVWKEHAHPILTDAERTLVPSMYNLNRQRLLSLSAGPSFCLSIAVAVFMDSKVLGLCSTASVGSTLFCITCYEGAKVKPANEKVKALFAPALLVDEARAEETELTY